MRTLMLGAAAVAVIAATASAADFDVNATDLPLADISSGSVSVEDCTEGLRLDVVKGDYLPGDNDWAVAGVDVRTAAGDIFVKCSGFEVTVVLERGDEAETGLAPVELPTVTVSGDGTQLRLPVDAEAAATLVGDVTHASVLVDEPNV